MATTSANLDMQMTPPPPDATSSRVPNPNSIPPSTPSSYLPPPSTASVGSGAMTSVSQKRKTPSTTGSAAVSQTLKRSHPVSAAAQLKAERDAMHPMLQKMTTFLDNAGPSVFQPIMLDSLGLTLLCLLYFAPILFAIPGDRTPNLTMITVITDHYTPYPMQRHWSRLSHSLIAVCLMFASCQILHHAYHTASHLGASCISSLLYDPYPPHAHLMYALLTPHDSPSSYRV